MKTLRFGKRTYVSLDSFPQIQYHPETRHVEITLPGDFDKYIEPDSAGVEMGSERLLSIVKSLVTPESSIDPHDYAVLARLRAYLESVPLENSPNITVVFSTGRGGKYAKWQTAFVRAHESGHVRLDAVLEDRFEIRVTKAMQEAIRKRHQGVAAFLPEIKTTPEVRQAFQLLRAKWPRADDLGLIDLLWTQYRTVAKGTTFNLWEVPVSTEPALTALFRRLFGSDVIDAYREATGYKSGKAVTYHVPHEIFADLCGFRHVTTELDCPKFIAGRWAYDYKAAQTVAKSEWTPELLLRLLNRPQTYCDLIMGK